MSGLKIIAYNNYKQGYRNDNLELESIYYDIYEENIYEKLYEKDYDKESPKGYIDEISIFVHLMDTGQQEYIYFTTDYKDENFVVSESNSQGRMDDVDTYLITGDLEVMIEYVCAKTQEIGYDELLRNIK